MKQNIQKPSGFKNERKQTDDSLNLERGKTDESFISGRGDVYENTNETVTSNRLIADRDRQQRRSEADEKRGEKSKSIINSEELYSASAEDALINQRKLEDNAIKSERSKMDLAIGAERGEKERLMNKLVIQEREATDKSLKGERTITDIETDRAAELLTLEHAEHMKTKSALTTREEFVAIVSHDLRNPLGAILSSTEILLDDFANTDVSGEVKNLVELIRRNAEISLRLIADILDMERIVEGKMQLQLTKNSINGIIKNTVDSFMHAARKKDILLKSSLTVNDKSIMCDKDRVAQILSNLVSNAIKFTPQGGAVTVDVQQNQNVVKVSVRDTGAGVPNDQKERIFERFAQLKNKDRSGLGLGLYISKTLVKSHSGNIGVTSAPESGSTFWFTLPT